MSNKAVVILIFTCLCVFYAKQAKCYEFMINSTTTLKQRNPFVVSNGSNYLVAWESNHQDGYWTDVYGQFFSTEGTKIASEFEINSYQSLHQSSPSLSSNGVDYLVAWTSGTFGAEPLNVSQDGSGDGIYGQFISGTGVNIGAEFKLNAYTNNHQRFSQVASDGTDYYAVWATLDEDGDQWGVSGNRLLSNSPSSGSTIINSMTNGIQEWPYIASNGSNYLVAWESFGSQGRDLYGQLVSKTGSLIGSEITINANVDSGQQKAAVASDGTNYLVTWENTASIYENRGLHGQLIDTNGLLVGSEFTISQDGTDHTVSSNGTSYLVTWREGGDLYGQFIALNGELWGGSFLVNENSYDLTGFSSIGTDGEDYFIVWESSVLAG